MEGGIRNGPCPFPPFPSFPSLPFSSLPFPSLPPRQSRCSLAFWPLAPESFSTERSAGLQGGMAGAAVCGMALLHMLPKMEGGVSPRFPFPSLPPFSRPPPALSPSLPFAVVVLCCWRLGRRLKRRCSLAPLWLWRAAFGLIRWAGCSDTKVQRTATQRHNDGRPPCHRPAGPGCRPGAAPLAFIDMHVGARLAGSMLPFLDWLP